MTDQCNKILRVEHDDLVLGYLRAQVDQLDNSLESEAETSEIKTRNCVSITAGISDSRTTLGSPNKMITVGEYLEKKGTDAAFTSFCTRVSTAVQAMSIVSTGIPAIDNSNKVRLYIFDCLHW